MNLFQQGGNGGFSPGRGLINPAFRITLVSPNDDMQQKRAGGRPNPNADVLDNLAISTTINWKHKGKTIQGKVQRLIKNEEGDVSYVIAKSEDGRSHKIEASRVQMAETNSTPESEYEPTSTHAYFNESILTFEQFLSTLNG